MHQTQSNVVLGKYKLLLDLEHDQHDELLVN
jgi:hypothetical protein